MRNATSVSQSAAGAPYGADWETQRRRVTAILLIAPVAIMTLLFLAPLAYLIWLSFGGPSGPNINSYKQLAALVYLNLAYYTLQLAFIVTIACAVIAYPLAYLLANIENAVSRFMIVGLLISLWLSVLARTYSWIIILQRNGVVNNLLLQAGITDEPLPLVYNETGVYIGMIHILLPYMVMTLYPTLRAIDSSLVRSALSLGASPWTAFRRVYFPLSLSGLVSGSILVFTMAIGFFVTPAILGGGRVNTIVMAIQNQVQVLVDLPLAAATSVVLLLVSLLILVVYEKIAGVERIFGKGR
ncbi:ABC transporter permease [Mesorhizobium sp. LHD-90]|uniref:ABC transporter permease n=1 Tax=Mesorhizobium sp. LHD-90 TaxID=3071414 RepID=UPI0027E01F73|nr:ABC transporter permease [Mesorhizobium sp. LHD-90]MDQ6432531.1 ABC transporter permease [Mesorhizobium sp. LHD-90]